MANRLRSDTFNAAPFADHSFRVAAYSFKVAVISFFDTWVKAGSVGQSSIGADTWGKLAQYTSSQRVLVDAELDVVEGGSFRLRHTFALR